MRVGCVCVRPRVDGATGGRHVLAAPPPVDDDHDGHDDGDHQQQADDGDHDGERPRGDAQEVVILQVLLWRERETVKSLQYTRLFIVTVYETSHGRV